MPFLKHFAAAFIIAAGIPVFAHGGHQHADDEIGCYIKDPTARYREHNVDFKTMFLNLWFKPEEKTVIGSVHYVFQPIQKDIDSLFLDGPGIDIKTVYMGDAELEFEEGETGAVIRFGQQLNWDKTYDLLIEYETKPAKGLYFIGWDDPTNRMRKQIWTQGQGIDNRHWIPSFDGVTDKLITATRVTFDADYTVVSNGVLKSKTENEDGTLSWEYEMDKPHVPYLVMLGIGKYDYRDIESENGMVSRQYYYPDRPEAFDPTYRYSAEMMDYLEGEFGVPYPWKTYANVPVSDFMYGAMENTTATIFTDYYVQDTRAALERNYIATNAHELTHQWWGDYITEWSGTHHWLHESFATHYAKHFMRHVMGEDEFQRIRRSEMHSSWNAAKNDDLPVAHSQAGSARHYPKGSLVIDMIRYVVGEEQYKQAVKFFLESHPYDNVDSHDFYLAFMKRLGINLDWFFNQWIYRGGEPEYKVEYTASRKEVLVDVTQTHERTDVIDWFRMPFEIELHYRDGSMDSRRVWVEDEKHEFRFEKTGKQKVSYVLFDPGWQVLKKLDFKKELDELGRQALNAEHMIDRYQAVLDMSSIALDEKKDLLIEIFNKEEYYLVRQEIVDQLSGDFNKDVWTVKEKALKDPHHLVRREALTCESRIPKEFLSHYLPLLEDSSYVTIAEAIRKLCREHSYDYQKFLERTDGLDGHYHNVRIAWLEMAIEMGEEDLLPELIDLSSRSFNHRTRTAAYEALKRLDMFDESMLVSLFDGATHFNRRLRGPANEAFERFYSTDEYRTYFDEYREGMKLQEWQSELLDKLMQ